MRSYMNYRKLSPFMKWVIGLTVAVIIAIGAYILVDFLGGIDFIKGDSGVQNTQQNTESSDKNADTDKNAEPDKGTEENEKTDEEKKEEEKEKEEAEKKETEKKAEEEKKKQENIRKASLFIVISFVAIAYIIISLYNLLSYKAFDDNRIYCLPIITSVIFLIIENALLHVFHYTWENTAYYQTTLGIFTTIAVGIITFAGLKFSFGISNQQKRLAETSAIKPEIKLRREKNNKYTMSVSRNDCYLCGLFVGKIFRIGYKDTIKNGNIFLMNKLYYPNEKIFYGKHGSSIWLELDLDKFSKKPFAQIQRVAQDNDKDIFLIFCDTQNFYYFAQLPLYKNKQNIIGVHDHAMTRLEFLHNKKESKFQNYCSNYNKYNLPIKYEVMDWFEMPYDFNPDKD